MAGVSCDLQTDNYDRYALTSEISDDYLLVVAWVCDAFTPRDCQCSG
jgi:hypothetical protein